MSAHSATKQHRNSKKIHGLRLVSSDDFTKVTFRFKSSLWVKLATRLRARGFSVSITNSKWRPVLVTSANFEEIELCLSSRVARRKLPRLAIYSSVGAVALALAFVPLPKAEVTQQAKADIDVPCAPEKIKAALTGRKYFDHISVTPAIQIGGVESGEVTCEARRYSYTLDLKEAKRVLKLLELDS